MSYRHDTRKLKASRRSFTDFYYALSDSFILRIYSPDREERIIEQRAYYEKSLNLDEHLRAVHILTKKGDGPNCGAFLATKASSVALTSDVMSQPITSGIL